MDQHDPYGPMLAELSDVNDADTDELFRDSLRKTQEYVVLLRQAYRNSPSNVDFSCENTRASYLLAYYPHYIETLYHILASLPEDVVRTCFDNEKLRGCFFGAGPAPEVVGWISFLQKQYPEVTCAMAYLLDKYSSQWQKCQEITRYHISPNYWNGKLIIYPMEFDLWDNTQEWTPRVTRAVKISNFFVMQNCLNDLLGRADDLLESFMRIFRATLPGSLFIVADLFFPNVLNLMERLVKEVEGENIGVSIFNPHVKYSEFNSNFEPPDIINECLLTGDDNLRPRIFTKYYYTVMVRSVDPELEEEVFPF